MISFIFKNKYKNFAVAFLSGLFFVFQFRFFYIQCVLYGCTDFNHLSLYFFQMLSPLLIFSYMITLKTDYKIKKWLFPFAFLFSVINVFLQTINDLALFSHYNNSASLISIVDLTEISIAVLINLIVMSADIFCLLGSLSNFKKIVLFRIGIIILSVHTVIINAFELIKISMTSYVEKYYFAYIQLFAFNIKLFQSILTLLFYLSILILAFEKKSEDIDITPFIEKRKHKKEKKKAQKLEREFELEALPQVAPEGFWCCGGCGKILPDGESRCECGYKKVQSKN